MRSRSNFSNWTKGRYLRAGVRWLILVDPYVRVVEVFEARTHAELTRWTLKRAVAGDDRLSLAEALDGFEVDLGGVRAFCPFSQPRTNA